MLAFDRSAGRPGTLSRDRITARPPRGPAARRDPAVPVHLRTVLGNLDTRTITLVAAAITTANG